MKKIKIQFEFRNFLKADSSQLKAVRGFTLIETLVALAIFSASIVALISITASGVANTNFAKNKFTASYLAQEGLEMVRNIRDTASIPNPATGWTQFTSTVVDACNSTFGCKIDPTEMAPASCATPVECSLKYNDNTGFYEYMNVQGQFNRLIKVEPILGSDEVKVVSTVSWNQGSVQKSVTITENLFDWIQ